MTTELPQDYLKENEDPALAPAASTGANIVEPKPAQQETAKKPFTSAGKRIHNELTYRGIDFLLNSTIGVLFTYWTARTKSGEKYWSKPVSGFFKKALKPMLKTDAALEEGAKWGSMFTSIIVGGTTIIPPMIMMEKKANKKAMIRYFDEQVYGHDAVAHDPKFQECYDAIDDEAKKNFTTGMTARFIVLAPMIAATVNPKTNAFMVKTLYNPIASASKNLCGALGIQPRGLMRKGTMELAEGDITKAKTFVSDWDFIHRTIGFDLGLTFIYSFAHEWTYKGLAAVGFRKTQDPKEDPGEPHMQPADLPAAPLAAAPVATTNDKPGTAITVALREKPAMKTLTEFAGQRGEAIVAP